MKEKFKKVMDHPVYFLTSVVAYWVISVFVCALIGRYVFGITSNFWLLWTYTFLASLILLVILLLGNVRDRMVKTEVNFDR